MSKMIVLGNRRCRPFKESLKALEADIQHANTMALGLPREKEGACLQMRLCFGPPFLLCFLSWADCRFISALGLLHVLIYKVLKDGTTTMSIHERKASLREFYGYILPSLQALDGGLTEREASAQKAACAEKYLKKTGAKADAKLDTERESECGICLETVSKVVLPNCYHSLCIKCYTEWITRSSSCPFCRLSLKHVKPQDLWILTEQDDIKDVLYVTGENMKRLFIYVDKLPLAVSNRTIDYKRKGHC
ncbi:hypothetical protein KP509_06G021200 [Ceratopteris richardii]|uniref:RING-type domain-containing protein n=1 Tax=Ceratopteris richardii TaxID=49495 RepID=A0A8T2UKX4_CERRI|nr:hypothetical protein KP509_06G021200 [Ceratopteris richardii]